MSENGWIFIKSSSPGSPSQETGAFNSRWLHTAYQTMLTDVWQVIKWRGRFGTAVKYLGGVQGFRSLFLRDGKFMVAV